LSTLAAGGGSDNERDCRPRLRGRRSRSALLNQEDRSQSPADMFCPACDRPLVISTNDCRRRDMWGQVLDLRLSDGGASSFSFVLPSAGSAQPSRMRMSASRGDRSTTSPTFRRDRSTPLI